MKKAILLLCCFTICCLTEERGNRVKRKVIFTKNSKIFFRLNGKDNVIPWIQIFAHGWAFRINWMLPETISRRHNFFKRAIHKYIDYSITQPEVMEGYACVIKYVCGLIYKVQASKSCKMFCEFGNIISRSRGVETDFFRSFYNKCDYYTFFCPYSFKYLSHLTGY